MWPSTLKVFKRIAIPTRPGIASGDRDSKAGVSNFYINISSTPYGQFTASGAIANTSSRVFLNNAMNKSDGRFPDCTHCMHEESAGTAPVPDSTSPVQSTPFVVPQMITAAVAALSLWSDDWNADLGCLMQQCLVRPGCDYVRSQDTRSRCEEVCANSGVSRTLVSPVVMICTPMQALDPDALCPSRSGEHVVKFSHAALNRLVHEEFHRIGTHSNLDAPVSWALMHALSASDVTVDLNE